MEKYNHEEQFKDDPEIEALETEVAEIDEQIKLLWQRRTAAARTIAQLRVNEGRPAYPSREEYEKRRQFAGIYLGGLLIDTLLRASRNRVHEAPNLPDPTDQ